MRTSSHKVALILVGVYILALAAILFWPSSAERPMDSAVIEVNQWLHSQGLRKRVVRYSHIEFVANIFLFVPLGIVLALSLPRRWWPWAGAIGAMISCAVELAQALFLPGRTPAWSDILANTSGAFLGALLVLLVWALRRRRTRRVIHQHTLRANPGTGNSERTATAGHGSSGHRVEPVTLEVASTGPGCSGRWWTRMLQIERLSALNPPPSMNGSTMRLGGFVRQRGTRLRHSARFKVLAVALALVLVGAVVGAVLVFRPDSTPGAVPAPGTLKVDDKPTHVFVINLENTSYDRAWGAESPAPYLSKTLRGQGVLLENYYSIYPSSLPNYIAQISGQGPNVNTVNDCAVFRKFKGKDVSVFGQLQGQGCFYPATVPTLVGQLESKGLTWRGYMEDMPEPCLRPEIGAADPNKRARAGNQYVTRHNPFVYFASITDSPTCAQNLVNLDALPADLASADTTRNLSYITPNVCNDGHDNPCWGDLPGGLVAADAWLQVWVPRIMDSAAYKDGGMLVITFDEGDGEVQPATDAATDAVPASAEAADVSAQASEGGTDQDPGAPLPGIFGKGGGRVGALVLSPLVEPGTSSQVVYNHYSLLGSIEDVFSLPYIGYATVTMLEKFGPDVYNKR